MSSISQFLTDKNNHPVRCWHGTCAQFDYFHPLSHFAEDKRISESYEFTHHVRPIREYFGEEMEEKMAMADVMRAVKGCRGVLTGEKQPKVKGRLIPVWLKIKKPAHFKFSWLDFRNYCEGMIYAYLVYKDRRIKKNISIPESDFIFKNPFEMAAPDVQKELLLDSLFQITNDDLIDKSHLAKQRFIQFWESFGYDSFWYDCAKSTVYAKDSYIYPELPNYNDKAYVIFRPEQVYRLDRPELNNHPLTPNTPENLQKLQAIRNRYIQQYKPRILDIGRQLGRIEARDCWCER